jgi:transcriptional regulator with XRE-family HTH domain
VTTLAAVEAVDEAVARRVRQLRTDAGLTQDQLARACERVGMGWKTSRVGQLETARVTVTPAVLYGVARAFADATGRAITLADLLPEDGKVLLFNGLEADVADLRAALSGEPVRLPVPPIGTIPDPRRDPSWGQVEDRVLAQTGEGSEAFVLCAAQQLYGRSGTQERELRAGPGATPQKRGRVTRHLVAELVAATQLELADSAAHDAALEGH